METIERGLLTFLLNALWQLPLAAGVAALACRWMRNSPARHRHAIWVAALAAGLALPVVSFVKGEHTPKTYAIPQQAAVATATAPVAPAESPEAPAVPSRRSTVTLGQATATALLAGYLVFLLAGIARLGLAWRRTLRAARGCADAALPAVVERIARRCESALGLRGVKVGGSEMLESPVAVGGRVVLPRLLMEENSEAVLTTALGHEMAHIARRDFAWNLVCRLLALPLSFHPAAWLVLREIERTREMACDELVTEKLLEAHVYAESILTIARRAVGMEQAGYALGVFGGDILEERIRRLLTQRPWPRRARLRLAAGLGALAVCVALASGLAVSALAQSAAMPEMRLAQEAFNAKNFDVAVQHFEKAVAADTNNLNARLYLALALSRLQQQNDPKWTADTADAPLVVRAREQYREVLKRDPRNAFAPHGIVATSSRFKAKESREVMMQAIAANPKNRSLYYTAGVLDWQIAYEPILKAGGKGLLGDWIPDPAVRQRLRSEVLPYIEEGFRVLLIALELQPGEGDAMAYLNLLGREKAAIVETRAEHDQLIAQADEWVKKAVEAKRARGGSRSVTSGPINVEEPPPVGIPAMAPPPPPPPPPPKAAGEAQARKVPPPPPPPPPPPKRAAQGDAPPPPPPPPPKRDAKGDAPPPPPPPPPKPEGKQ